MVSLLDPCGTLVGPRRRVGTIALAYGCLATSGTLLALLARGSALPSFVGAATYIGFYLIGRSRNRNVGPVATTPNTCREPLFAGLIVVAFVLIPAAIFFTLRGSVALLAVCVAAIVPILTILLLRKFSMDFASLEGRLPERYRYRPRSQEENT